jgi:hypothetical protein
MNDCGAKSKLSAPLIYLSKTGNYRSISEQDKRALVWNKAKSTLSITKGLWGELTPPGGFVEALKNEVIKLSSTKPYNLRTLPEKAVDAARPLRAAFNRYLRLQRSNALDLILRTDSQQQLCDAATALTTSSYIEKHRSGLYGPPPYKGVDSSLRVGVDIELLDLFLCSLQALSSYLQEASSFVCSAYSTKILQEQDVGASFSYAITGTTTPQVYPESSLRNFYDRIYRYVGDYQKKQERKLQNTASQRTNDFDRALQALKPTRRNILKKTHRDILWPARHIAESYIPPQILKDVIASAGLLSSEVHEGRGLRFAFVLSSGLLWREVEETLSHETDSAASKTLEEFAKLVHAHWSIFQAERVVGVVDVEQILKNPGKIILSKLVRLKVPPRWSGLPSQVFSHVAKVIEGSSIVYAAGDGRILVYHGRLPVLRWDVRTNEIDTLGTVDETVENILKIVGLSEPPDNVFLSHIRETLGEALQEVSETRGEGALLFCLPPNKNGGLGNKFHKIAQSIVRPMDQDKYRMAWRKEKSLESLDRTLLRAMLVLDGASVIKDQRITPRFVVYPHVKTCNQGPHAFSVMDFTRDEQRLCDCGKKIKDILGGDGRWMSLRKKHIRRLDGKGSKHHGAANASVLLWEAAQEQKLSFRVITISADGPIKEWPDELGLGEKERA